MRATASKVGLLSFCQWWARPEAQWSYTTSAAAERGTRFHSAIAKYLAGAEAAPEADIAEEYERAKEWIDSLGVSKARLGREIAFAWDPETDTSESLGHDTARDYSKGAGRLCGTADLVMLVMGDLEKTTKPVAAMVWDWKTGSGEGAGPQLRALGLMVARAYDVEQVTVAALEVRASGVTEVAREDLDSFALASIAGELAEQLAAVRNATPLPGSHCGELYCPARLACPAGTEATAQVVDLIPAEQLVRRTEWRITDPVKTAEQAIWTVDVLRLMGAWIDAKKDEIKGKVPADGWVADDGRVLREGECEKSAFDKHKALALCKQLGATPEQIASLNYTFKASTGLRVSGGNTKPRARRGKAA